MTALQHLLPETARFEADHAELMRKFDELHRQFELEDRRARAAFEDKLRAIDAQFEQQRASIAAQLDLSLRETIESVLRQKRDLEIDVLQRTHSEQADARRKCYDEQTKAYRREIYPLFTALMRTQSTLAAHHLLPQLPTACLPGNAKYDRIVPDHTAGQAGGIPAAAASPVPIEVPPQPHGVASLLLVQAAAETGGQPPPPRGVSHDAATRSPSYSAVHGRDDAPSVPSRQGGTAESNGGEPASPVPVPTPATLYRGTDAAPAPEERLPDCVESVGGQDRPSAGAKPPLAGVDPIQKRKADGEPVCESPASPQKRIKRTKSDSLGGEDGASLDQPSPVQKPCDRTVSFEDVYGEPGKPPQYRHIIVEYPIDSGDFYILRCDEHGVHFGEHPLRGAAKHLASAQHNHMSKTHAIAIETIGHRVVGCTRKLALKNNSEVLKAFRDGAYKVFNANNLSQAKRAQLGYPPLDSQGTPKAALPKKPAMGVTDPVPCRFYVGTRAELKCPVLILPWGDTSPAGIHGTLAETGIFHDASADGSPLRVPSLPKCYVYYEVGGRILGIQGWASGYEIGGPLERKREFPVLCAENADYRLWTVGWVKAAHLSPLDFDDPSSWTVPFFKVARDYYVHRILGRRGAASTRSAEAGARTGGEDVDMEDGGPARNTEHDSDQDPGRPERGAGDKSTPTASRDPISPVTSARVIAAQALNLQTPATSSFRPINAASTRSGTSTPRAPSESFEPPSMAASVPNTDDGHRRVFKIHARSRNEQYPAGRGDATPPIVLPERPADGTASQNGAAHHSTSKPGPASLRNILQEFPSPNPDPSRPGSHSPKPAGTRRPLPSAPVRTASHYPRPLLPAISAVHPETPREVRAGSAPAQPQLHRDPWDSGIRRAGSAATAPSPSRDVTPQPVAPESDQKHERPLRLQLPPLPTPFSPTPHLSTTPLATTPTPSAGNTRSNSPNPAHSSTGLPTPGILQSDVPVSMPKLPPATAFLPTMEVFDLSGFMEDSKELFRSGVPGHYLRLIDDHQTGVLTTASDSPVAVRIDPKKIKSAERMPAQGGAVCVVKLVYHAAGEGGAGEGEHAAAAALPQRTHTLVFEKAQSTASGLQNGVVHARRFCRRLHIWNPDIVCPMPAASSSDNAARPPSVKSRETTDYTSGSGGGEATSDAEISPSLTPAAEVLAQGST